MSNDSSRPRPDPRKIESKASKQAVEATEMDLWDLGSDDTDFERPAEIPPSEPAGIPERRKTVSSNLQSKKKGERHVELRNVEEMNYEDKPGEQPVPEPVADEEPTSKDNGQQDDPAVPKAAPEDKAPEPEPMRFGIASLSKIEKIAIFFLFAGLALIATLTFIHFSNRVPTRPLVAKEIDFPISGKIVEITAASTYWREPVTTGENADVVRRGTQLIPVLKLNLTSKSGVVRVFFRNEDDTVIGDGITRAVKGDTELTMAATAGFEDVGMHTAYRTGDSEPWVVQVFEGPDAKAPREKFRKILETEISTLIR